MGGEAAEVRQVQLSRNNMRDLCSDGTDYRGVNKTA